MDPMLPSPGFSIPSIGTPLHQPEEDQQILPQAQRAQHTSHGDITPSHHPFAASAFGLPHQSPFALPSSAKTPIHTSEHDDGRDDMKMRLMGNDDDHHGDDVRRTGMGSGSGMGDVEMKPASAMSSVHFQAPSTPAPMTPLTPAGDPGIVPQLQNIVSTVNLGCQLDLKHIALHARNAEYNPKRFAAVIMRIRDPRTTALIFSSGKMVCTGAKSEDDSRLAARKYARIVQKLGFEAKFLDFKIQNMVGSCDVKFPIRLEGLVLTHSQFSSYEPELFPGLIYRMVKPRIVLLIFVSGKVVLTGKCEKLIVWIMSFRDFYWRFNCALWVVLLLNSSSHSIDLGALDDGVLFALKWPGLEPENLIETIEPGAEIIDINTREGESFKCVIPPMETETETSKDEYTGPNALELLEPLVHETSCSFRLESYWTYEVCHGKYVRQYHPDGKAAEVQEYYLGRWDADRYKAEVAKLGESLKRDGPKIPLPTKKIDGMNVPYVEMNMTDGTLCDLRPGSARSVRVLYICYRQGQHQIFSLEETRTCEYEVVVLSPLLCAHPDYRVRDRAHNDVSCYAADADSSAKNRRPFALREMEAESLKLRHQTTVLELSAGSGKRFAFEMNPVTVEEIKDVVDQLSAQKDTPGRDEIGNKEPVGGHRGTVMPVPKPDLPLIYDAKLVEGFLAGTYCLHGGTGWWKYEFCYGKKVLQYHVEIDGSKKSVLLGEFNKDAHMEWLMKNPRKQPIAGIPKKSVSHFYTGGAICDITGQPRHVEVKLKCREPVGGPGTKVTESSNAVTLYLWEPDVCSYVLGVESAILCPLLDTADEYGFLSAPHNNFEIKGIPDNEEPKEEKRVLVGVGEAIPVPLDEASHISKLTPSSDPIPTTAPSSTEYKTFDEEDDERSEEESFIGMR
ncbi:unnamed protein product [Notodromas monacha]|uniref:TATA-box-binding protein n=1 Tax=Notodromas monacha TaxID=399045 RepID=A0A7R9BEL9_9CRUS|nr:unnamed protein product [Notodromas monacha]CAG0912370.1 unnamed protein product [Notodromas monacha]